MAVDADGHLWSWGKGGSGQLGNGRVVDQLEPVPLFQSLQNGPSTTGSSDGASSASDTSSVASSTAESGSACFSFVAAGVAHSAAVDINGDLYVDVVAPLGFLNLSWKCWQVHLGRARGLHAGAR